MEQENKNNTQADKDSKQAGSLAVSGGLMAAGIAILAMGLLGPFGAVIGAALVAGGAVRMSVPLVKEAYDSRQHKKHLKYNVQKQKKRVERRDRKINLLLKENHDLKEFLKPRNNHQLNPLRVSHSEERGRRRERSLSPLTSRSQSETVRGRSRGRGM